MPTQAQVEESREEFFRTDSQLLRNQIISLGASEDLADRIMELPEIKGPLKSSAVSKSMWLR